MESHQQAALVFLPIALIGVMANWTVSILITNLKSMKNAFGRLNLSQSMGDGLHSTLFLFYFVPMCYFMSYTNIYIALSWGFAIIPSFYLYLCNDCKFFYIDEFWAFIFSTTPVCLTITWYADFLKYNSIVIFIMVIDIITVIKVRMFNEKLAISTSPIYRSNEMNFLKQACLQALVFVCELITYFIITPKVGSENRWTRFFLSTVAWVCVHMLDGIITIVFNNEFWTFILGCMKKPLTHNSISNYQRSSGTF